MMKSFACMMLTTLCLLSSDAAHAGAVGGPKNFPGYLGPQQTTNYQLDLIGGQTQINIVSNGYVQVRVVGALTGLEYGRSEGQNAQVTFTHLPVAKVRVEVTNVDPNFAVQFQLLSN